MTKAAIFMALTANWQLQVEISENVPGTLEIKLNLSLYGLTAL